MRITKFEITMMISFGIMIPTGDNYLDIWLSTRFFTGTYNPAASYFKADWNDTIKDFNIKGTVYILGQ
jgi:hypothetical protein